jgi:hypothetical protein
VNCLVGGDAAGPALASPSHSLVVDGVTGYLTQPGDVSTLNDALDEIIADGAAAAKRATRGASWSNVNSYPMTTYGNSLEC